MKGTGFKYTPDRGDKMAAAALTDGAPTVMMPEEIEKIARQFVTPGSHFPFAFRVRSLEIVGGETDKERERDTDRQTGWH